MSMAGRSGNAEPPRAAPPRAPLRIEWPRGREESRHTISIKYFVCSISVPQYSSYLLATIHPRPLSMFPAPSLFPCLGILELCSTSHLLALSKAYMTSRDQKALHISPIDDDLALSSTQSLSKSQHLCQS